MFRIDNNKLSVPMPSDDEGYTGRECPNCEAYFKIVFGTGLQDTSFCYCPYCGYYKHHNGFTTQAQNEYIISIARNYFSSIVLDKFKELERKYPPNRGRFLNISIKATGTPTPIQYYTEKKLETRIECGQCTLKYSVYGVFAHCPDCGEHNSHQILEKNLELAKKELELASNVDEYELSEYLIADSLENVVSAFDGFGREICKIYSARANEPKKAVNISFQNLYKAQHKVLKQFGIDIADALPDEEWHETKRCFQKRHLLAHKMGIIDEEYVSKADDISAIVGHKVPISPEEVSLFIDYVRTLGKFIFDEIKKIPK